MFFGAIADRSPMFLTCCTGGLPHGRSSRALRRDARRERRRMMVDAAAAFAAPTSWLLGSDAADESQLQPGYPNAHGRRVVHDLRTWSFQAPISQSNRLQGVLAPEIDEQLEEDLYERQRLRWLHELEEEANNIRATAAPAVAVVDFGSAKSSTLATNLCTTRQPSFTKEYSSRAVVVRRVPSSCKQDDLVSMYSKTGDGGVCSCAVMRRHGQQNCWAIIYFRHADLGTRPTLQCLARRASIHNRIGSIHSCCAVRMAPKPDACVLTAKAPLRCVLCLQLWLPSGQPKKLQVPLGAAPRTETGLWRSSPRS